MTCLFCEKNNLVILERNDCFYALRDKFPVTELHTLLISFRHVESYFDLNNAEIEAFNELLFSQKKSLLEEDASISGFNVGFNAGEDAGQTVMHCHMHLIPRRHGDMENPRGGVRGVIPERRDY